jgi:hypothetical protein
MRDKWVVRSDHAFVAAETRHGMAHLALPASAAGPLPGINGVQMNGNLALK